MRPRLVIVRAAATTTLAMVTPMAYVAAGPPGTVAAAEAATPGAASGAAPSLAHVGSTSWSTPRITAAAPVTPTVTHVPIPAVTSPSSAASSPASNPAPKSSTRSSAATGSTSSDASGKAGSRKVVAAVSRSGSTFDVVGVTYRGAAPAGLAVEVRTHSVHGWTAWIGLDVDDGHGPDAGTTEARRARAGTDPLTAAGSDAVDVRVLSDGGAAPRDLALSMVDAKSAPSDAAVAGSSVGAASARQATASADRTLAGTASVAQPSIVTRAQWGADERLMPCQPDALGGFKAGVVHHTVNANNYTAAQAPGLVRGIFAYHTQSQGWCDIGYNFLVDRFGRIYEGRKGGLTGFTQGAHAGGFNEETFGVSVIGTFTSVKFPSAVAGAVSRTIAWQADRSGFNPGTSVVLTSNGSSRYDAGVQVTKPRVMGHRDVSLTSCPGDAAYPQVAGIKSSASSTWRASQYVVGRSVYAPVTPRRILDTRTGLGASRRPVPANTSIVLQVPGLPSTATAVTLNVTALGATTPTTVTAYPANMSRRLTANLNLVPRRTVATQVTVGVAPGGTVRLYNSAGSVNLVADLAGYFRTGTGAGYTAYLRPARLVDTRTGLGAPRRQLAQGRPVTFTIPGLPSGTRAVSFNLTALNASTPTYLTAYRAGTARPGVSNVNVDDRNPVSNLVTIPVDSAGRVTVSVAQGQVDLIVDAAGYYADGRGARFVAVAPRRVLDTRVGWAVDRGPLPAGRAVTIGIPNTTYTVVGAALSSSGISTTSGWVSLYRAGQSPPPISTLFTAPGRTITNLASTGAYTHGLVNVYNAAGSTHVIADLMGYYTY